MFLNIVIRDMDGFETYRNEQGVGLGMELDASGKACVFLSRKGTELNIRLDTECLKKSCGTIENTAGGSVQHNTAKSCLDGGMENHEYP